MLAVIPAWNGEKSVGSTITELRAECANIDIRGLDDGSSDRTAERHGYDVLMQVDADGQHDPVIYGAFAEEHPQAVEAICIRELTPAEQVLSSGLPVPTDELLGKKVEAPMLKAPNGYGLHQLLVSGRGRSGA